MRISGEIKAFIERWDDPGDYPNAVAGGPLLSRNYVGDVAGVITFHVAADEPLPPLDELADEAASRVDPAVLVTSWHWIAETIDREDGITLVAEPAIWREAPS